MALCNNNKKKSCNILQLKKRRGGALSPQTPLQISIRKLKQINLNSDLAAK